MKPKKDIPAKKLSLEEKRAIAVGKLCEQFSSGKVTLRVVLFAMCFIAETGYVDVAS